MNVINVLGPVMVILVFRLVIDWSIREDGDEEKEEELQSSSDAVGDEILDTFEDASCDEDAVNDGR